MRREALLTPLERAVIQSKRDCDAKRAAHRSARQLLRRQARFTPEEILAQDQQRLKRRLMKESEADLLKEACMKREVKKAKKIAERISPKMFQTVDIHKDDDEKDGTCDQVKFFQSNEIGGECAKATEIEALFAGQITIQDRLAAMNQALSEHAQYGTLRTAPGRHSFHVDAAVSREHGTTGLAVAHKTHRQNWASPWTAEGYQIKEALEQVDAETWAICRHCSLYWRRFTTTAKTQSRKIPAPSR